LHCTIGALSEQAGRPPPQRPRVLLGHSRHNIPPTSATARLQGEPGPSSADLIFGRRRRAGREGRPLGSRRGRGCETSFTRARNRIHGPEPRPRHPGAGFFRSSAMPGRISNTRAGNLQQTRSPVRSYRNPPSAHPLQARPASTPTGHIGRGVSPTWWSRASPHRLRSYDQQTPSRNLQFPDGGAHRAFLPDTFPDPFRRRRTTFTNVPGLRRARPGATALTPPFFSRTGRANSWRSPPGVETDGPTPSGGTVLGLSSHRT